MFRAVYEVEGTASAEAEGRIGTIFGAENGWPIEDVIRLVGVMRRCGLMIM